MRSKYDQLEQLKKLLDSGALTQEEFDSAKKRLLDADDEQPVQNQQNQPSLPVDNAKSPNKKKSKWLLIGGGIVAVAIIIIIALSRSGNNEVSYSDDYEAAEQVYIENDTVAYDISEEIGDGLTIGNPWRKGFFQNEWGEDITNSPYLYTNLNGTGWDIHIDYIPPTSELRWGAFRFWLLDNDGRLTSSYGPVNILVRGSDGETNSIEVTGTRDGITFVEEPASIETLKHYLNQESFDIRMEFDKYNERHSTQAGWNSSDGSLLEAIDKLL